MNKQPHNLLTDDHSKLDKMLDQVFAALRDGDSRQSFERLDHFWARLAMHIRAEHLHLFPALLSSIRAGEGAINETDPSSNSVTGLIGRLHLDHDYFMTELTGAIKQMRSLITNGETNASCILVDIAIRLDGIRARLKSHDELEEAEIYTLADLTHSPAEVLSLNTRIRKELENLPPRFAGRSIARK